MAIFKDTWPRMFVCFVGNEACRFKFPLELAGNLAIFNCCTNRFCQFIVIISKYDDESQDHFNEEIIDKGISLTNNNDRKTIQGIKWKLKWIRNWNLSLNIV